ncbi:MAG: DUF1761 domain-containing protein [Candidatus Peribacteraceae bacterium]|nr:DUF1761 domain-containing protein [Candidatus Peribacteraceae bacterium]
MLDFAPNIIGIILSVIAIMAIGMAWYSPSLFGKQWISMTHFAKMPKKEMQQKAKMGYIVSLVSSIIMAFIFNAILQTMSVTSAGEASIYGLILWAGFVATTIANSYAFNQKPLKLFAIDAGYYLASIMAAGVLLTSF